MSFSPQPGFNRLIFLPHRLDKSALRATIDFENGYGASIINWTDCSINPAAPYELCVMKGGKVCFDTHVADDLCCELTEGAVSELLNKIEALPP